MLSISHWWLFKLWSCFPLAIFVVVICSLFNWPATCTRGLNLIIITQEIGNAVSQTSKKVCKICVSHFFRIKALLQGRCKYIWSNQSHYVRQTRYNIHSRQKNWNSNFIQYFQTKKTLRICTDVMQNISYTRYFTVLRQSISWPMQIVAPIQKKSC